MRNGPLAAFLGIAGSVTVVLGALAYPVWLVVRLARMVREAKAYKDTGVPPTWR